MSLLVNYEKILTRLSDPSFSHLLEAFNCVMSALYLYDFKKTELWLSFNGGKDSTVVLHLLRLGLYKLSIDKKDGNLLPKIPSVYFEEKSSFEEMDSFISENVKSFNLELVQFPKDYSLINKLKEENNLKAIILGTRKTDPYCSHLNHFSPSDVPKGFPAFMRVNPVINWNYQQIWSFLREFEIPYCSLYDQGYTYLGNSNNSLKNENLRNEDGLYSPAYLCPGVFENESRKKIYSSSQKINENAKIFALLLTQDTENYWEKVEKFMTFIKEKQASNNNFFREIRVVKLDKNESLEEIFKKIESNFEEKTIEVCFYEKDFKEGEMDFLKSNKKVVEISSLS